MQQVAARHDPAPSRFKYRLERLLLTPLFRFALRVGVPFAVAFGGLTWWLSYPENREMVFDTYAEMRAQVEQRPEFMVSLMAIDGASEGVSEDIREILPLDFPVSSFDLDLEQMRDIVMDLDAVKSAHLFIREGILQIDVVERAPVVLWRTEDGLELLDETGVMVGPVEHRATYSELPLIVGDGASDHVPEALALFAAARPLADRVRGLVRMGERRWDMVLDRGQRILLPETGAVQALERTIAMDQAVDLLARDLVAVDLRLPERPTLRMTGSAVRELWRIREIEAGKNNND